jgi:hypothetical protein
VIGPFGTPIETTTVQGNVQAAYELDPFGRLENTTRAAEFDYAGQQALLDATALSVAANTASGYLNLRGLDAQLELARADPGIAPALAGPGAAPVRGRLQLAPGAGPGRGRVPRHGRRRAAARAFDRPAGKRAGRAAGRQPGHDRARHGAEPA